MKLNKFEKDFFARYLPDVNEEIRRTEGVIKDKKLYISEPHERNGQFSMSQEMCKRQIDDLGQELVDLNQLANKLAKHTYINNL